MHWQSEIKGFQQYLQLEKSLSPNSISAYIRDISQFANFVCEQNHVSAKEVKLQIIQSYLVRLNEIGIAESSQARFISSVRGFFKYLLLENEIQTDPSELLEMPKLKRKLPDVLSHDEIQEMIQSIDVSQKAGHRNRALLQVLYGCGLRVSECCNLVYSRLYQEEEFIKVTGKGNKQRLVPIHSQALEEIERYEDQMRNHMPIQEKHMDNIFLSARGNPLSRVMIYNIVKTSAQKAGIEKKISPHTLRHSFATELVKNGANLRAVQDMLGHASITTTEIYTHLDQQHLRNTIEQFHPLFND